MKEHAEYMMLC